MVLKEGAEVVLAEDGAAGYYGATSALWAAVAMPDVDSLKSSLYNGAYMLRVAVSDMLDSDSLFPKAHQGDLFLAGGASFESEDNPEFKRSLRSYTWFSYRQGFSGLPDISYDTGWGCVHRTGQMMLMTALRRHLLASQPSLLPHFRDLPSAPFSIQAITNRGVSFGKSPGQWFAPSTIGHVLKELVAEQCAGNGILASNPLHVTVVVDQQVPCKQVMANAASGGVLLLIPFMFGMDTVTPPNEQLLMSLLRNPYSVGIIGGRPRHALYFVGAKGSRLIHLDPHRVQPAFVDEASFGSTVEPKRNSIAVSDLDPCCLVAFYARGTEDVWNLLCSLQSQRLYNTTYPIFDMKHFASLEKKLGTAAPTGPYPAPPPVSAGACVSPPPTPPTDRLRQLHTREHATPPLAAIEAAATAAKAANGGYPSPPTTPSFGATDAPTSAEAAA